MNHIRRSDAHASRSRNRTRALRPCARVSTRTTRTMTTSATTQLMFQRQTNLAAQPLLCARCEIPAATRDVRNHLAVLHTTRCSKINATAALKMYRPHGINFRTAC